MKKAVLCFRLSVLALPSGACAQQDDGAVLSAVSAEMKAQTVRADSVRTARCRDGPASMWCLATYPRPEVWFLDTVDERVGAALAEAYGVVSVAGTTTTPHCPWPADAPEQSGYRVRAVIGWVSTDTARVIVEFRCLNPTGYLHREYALDRRYVVERIKGKWTARLIDTRVT